MKKFAFKFVFAFFGVIIAIYISAFLAEFSDDIYPSYVNGSDDLDRLYLIFVYVSLAIFAPFLGYLGVKIGGKIFNKLEK